MAYPLSINYDMWWGPQGGFSHATATKYCFQLIYITVFADLIMDQSIVFEKVYEHLPWKCWSNN